MKQLFGWCIGCCVLTSCGRQGGELPGKSTSSVVRNDEVIVVSKPPQIQENTDSEKLNFVDSKGRKQGVWKKHLNGKLWKVETYVNNRKHGQQFEYQADGAVTRTDYVNGLKHGYLLHFNPSASHGAFVSYSENGQFIWAAFPWELKDYIVPVKGFWTDKDTVEIKVPYNSGKLMYRGTIVPNKDPRKRAIGIHRAYYETGELKAVVDYNQDSIWVYNRKGKRIVKEAVAKWRGPIEE